MNIQNKYYLLSSIILLTFSKYTFSAILQGSRHSVDSCMANLELLTHDKNTHKLDLSGAVGTDEIYLRHLQQEAASFEQEISILNNRLYESDELPLDTQVTLKSRLEQLEQNLFDCQQQISTTITQMTYLTHLSLEDTMSITRARRPYVRVQKRVQQQRRHHRRSVAAKRRGRAKTLIDPSLRNFMASAYKEMRSDTKATQVEINRLKALLAQETAAEKIRPLTAQLKAAKAEKSASYQNLAHVRRLVRDITDPDFNTLLKLKALDGTPLINTDELLAATAIHDVGKSLRGKIDTLQAAGKVPEGEDSVYTGGQLFWAFMKHEEFGVKLTMERGKALGLTTAQIKSIQETILGHNGPALDDVFWGRMYTMLTKESYVNVSTANGYVLTLLDRVDQGRLVVKNISTGVNELVGGPRKIFADVLAMKGFAGAVEEALITNTSDTMRQFQRMQEQEEFSQIYSSAFIQARIAQVRRTQHLANKITKIPGDDTAVLVSGVKVSNEEELFRALAKTVHNLTQ